MKKMDLQIFADPALPKNPITPEINYETEAFINTTPSAESPTWVTMANLMTNMSQSLNEVIQQLSYYADKGWGSSEVTGAQLTLTLTGSVKPGDKACDYILGDEVMYGLGEKNFNPHFRKGSDLTPLVTALVPIVFQSTLPQGK